MSRFLVSRYSARNSSTSRCAASARQRDVGVSLGPEVAEGGSQGETR